MQYLNSELVLPLFQTGMFASGGRSLQGLPLLLARSDRHPPCSDSTAAKTIASRQIMNAQCPGNRFLLFISTVITQLSSGTGLRCAFDATPFPFPPENNVSSTLWCSPVHGVGIANRRSNHPRSDQRRDIKYLHVLLSRRCH